MFNQNGIFKRAKQSTESYKKSEAEEALIAVLSEAQMRKYESGLTDEQLTEMIENAGGTLLAKENPDLNEQEVAMEGHIFLIDTSVPKYIKYVRPAEGAMITAIVTGNENYEAEGKSIPVEVNGTIKYYGKGTIKTVTAKLGSQTLTSTTTPRFTLTGEKYKIDNMTINANTIINITVVTEKDGEETTTEKPVAVTIKRDTTGPTIKEANIEINTNGKDITISAKAEDSESGIEKFTYTVTPNVSISQASGEFKEGETVNLKATDAEDYEIVVKAIDKAGNETTAPSKTILAGGVEKHIKTTTGLKTINTRYVYGNTVTGYTCGRSDAEWQIFYIDETDNNRVYLIAKDYMVPPLNNATTKLIKSKNSSYPKAYGFGTSDTDTSILGKFTGNIPNTPFTKKYLSYYAGKAASTTNLQATNYMLDQTIWSEYMSTKSQSDYAFGGATLPLLQVSYNDICKSATTLGIQQSGTGYQVNIGGGSFADLQGVYGNETRQKGIYFKGDSSGIAECYWLASPSSHDQWCGLTSAFTGYISYDRVLKDVGGNGLRPIISLKADIQFTDNNNGTYTLP